MSSRAFARGLYSRAVSPHHHGSHRRLLTEPIRFPDPADVDAIIVPTSRTSPYLQTAIDLARDLGCILVALCSKQASVRQAEERAWAAGIELVAINFRWLPDELLPQFNTTSLLEETRFSRYSDLSQKRNLGLMLSLMAGWQKVFFLDDDIAVPEPSDIEDAASLLKDYAAVGLRTGGFPDNSVVCHAYREAGGMQETFIGGGAIAVGQGSMTSFFPNIYNEDWFFLLDDVRLRPTAVTGTAIQTPYDPFVDDRRARAEEFGDTLAEGIYSLLDHGRRVQDADLAFWREFLPSRRRLIDQIIDMILHSNKDDNDKRKMIVALDGARRRNQHIKPELCVEYIRAWRADRTRWRRHLGEMCGPYRRYQRPLDKILCNLGLMDCSVYTTSYERRVIPRAAGVRRSSRVS